MSNIDISVEDAFNQSCSGFGEPLDDIYCIYLCYVLGVISTSTNVVQPSYCANLNLSKDQIAHLDRNGIIIGSIAFVLVLILFVVLLRLYWKKKCQTSPEDPPDTTEAPLARVMNLRFQDPPGFFERIFSRLRSFFTNCTRE